MKLFSAILGVGYKVINLGVNVKRLSLLCIFTLSFCSMQAGWFDNLSVWSCLVSPLGSAVSYSWSGAKSGIKSIWNELRPLTRNEYNQFVDEEGGVLNEGKADCLARINEKDKALQRRIDELEAQRLEDSKKHKAQLLAVEATFVVGNRQRDAQRQEAIAQLEAKRGADFEIMKKALQAQRDVLAGARVAVHAQLSDAQERFAAESKESADKTRADIAEFVCQELTRRDQTHRARLEDFSGYKARHNLGARGLGGRYGDPMSPQDYAERALKDLIVE